MPNDGKLLASARKLLRGTAQSYLDIYSATGLSPTWLSMLANNKLRDPSVNKVEALYKHLSGKELIN